MIYKKELQCATTRRAGLLEGFQVEMDFYDCTGYLNNKFSLCTKQAYGTDQQYGGPLIYALNMAHVRSDKNGRKGEITKTQGLPMWKPKAKNQAE